ncbi:MAG TPA: hypothetical protein VE131_00155, partial [Terriglobales bacterium]|nr:hypothetical protein [Terriglobales bacterium]
GLYLCLRYAWKARHGVFGMLPLALLVTVLSANLAHTFLTRKPQWLILAFAAAAGLAVRKKPSLRVVRYRTQRYL